MIPAASIPVLDRAEALRRAGGDEKLFKELAAVFLGDVARLTRLIDDAIVQQSALGLRQAAHSLRGSASQIGALAVAGRALVLETMGKAGELHDAEKQQHLLKAELRQLSQELQAIIS